MNAIEAVYKFEEMQKQRHALELAIKLLQKDGNSDDWPMLGILWRQLTADCDDLKGRLMEVTI